jgi:cell division protein FtsQ
MIKRVLNIAFLVLGTVGLLISLAFTAKESQKVPCKDVKIIIDHASDNFFITESDVWEMILSKGDSIKGSPVTSIPIGVYERHITANPSVKRAEVYTKHNGVLVVKVYQREPILRVFNSAGNSFYLDKEGSVMPPSKNYTAKVSVASGSISDQLFEMERHNVTEMSDSLKDQSCLDELFELATFIKNDAFWRAQIQQIRVESNNEFTLIPTVGDHHILFGKTDKMEQKFNKLHLFYTKGLNTTGWDQYSRINLKYKDQVICTKKNR